MRIAAPSQCLKCRVPCEEHRYAETVRRFHAVAVAHRAAGLYDGGNAARRRRFDVVAKGKKASDASAAPFALSPAARSASRTLTTRFGCPAPMPASAPSWRWLWRWI